MPTQEVRRQIESFYTAVSLTVRTIFNIFLIMSFVFCAKVWKQNLLYDPTSSFLSLGMKNDLLKRVKEFVTQ
jgi:hypothetical protein